MLSLCLIIVSCGPQANQGDGSLARSPMKHQPDIPVPLSFAYSTDESRVEVFPSFRLCELVYASRPDAKHGIKAALEFYVRLMPQYEWENASKELGKKHSLLFRKKDKEDEYCRIDLARDGEITRLFILVGNAKLTKTK